MTDEEIAKQRYEEDVKKRGSSETWEDAPSNTKEMYLRSAAQRRVARGYY